MFTRWGLAFLGVAVLCCAPRSALARDVVIRLALRDSFFARSLETLSRGYTSPDGNKVEFKFEYIAWPDYYPRVASSLGAYDKRYNIIMPDSQWVSHLVANGHLVRLNSYLNADKTFAERMAKIRPALVTPQSITTATQQSLYAVPFWTETLVLTYRRDIVCNREESAAFKAKTKKVLPCEPADWETMDWADLRKVAQFLTRKAGDRLAGTALKSDFFPLAFQQGRAQDYATTQIYGVIWQGGREIWSRDSGDETSGVASKSSVSGLKTYLSLLPTMDPTLRLGSSDTYKSYAALKGGRAAIMVNWSGYGETLLSETPLIAEKKIDFASVPGTRVGGSLERWSNIGAMGLAVTSSSDEAETREAMNFLKWWTTFETQRSFAKITGQSIASDVTDTDEFKRLRPWNEVWRQSLKWQLDLPPEPDYFGTIIPRQQELDRAIIGEIAPEMALGRIAEMTRPLIPSLPISPRPDWTPATR